MLTHHIFQSLVEDARKEDRMDYRDRHIWLRDMLYRSGLTRAQIESLGRLSKEYATREMCITAGDQGRLAFVRWLVLTGRMSEQIAY